MEEERLQLALASDRAMVEPAMVVLGSLLARTEAKLRVHFLGHGLLASDRYRLAGFCAAHDCDFVYHEVTEADFDGARPANSNIPLVALARLHLPSWVEGRILYLDCDMLVLGDVAELFALMPQGAALGAVRDFYVLDQMARGGDLPEKLAWHRQLLGRDDVRGYFNSGLLLMDCDVIRREPALREQMSNVSASEGMRFMDQDYLNLIFDGQVHYLPLAWNCIWGRQARRGRSLARLVWLPEAECRPERTQLIHYTGPRKPWKRQGLLSALLSRRLAALRAWRREARGILG